MERTSLHRPRSSSRFFGALFSFLLLAGQTALIAHHHAQRAPNGGGVSLSQHDGLGADANCELCSLSAQSCVAQADAAPLAVSVPVVERSFDVPSIILGRIAALLPSSRGPPSA